MQLGQLKIDLELTFLPSLPTNFTLLFPFLPILQKDPCSLGSYVTSPILFPSSHCAELAWLPI